MKTCNTCTYYAPITATIGYCHHAFQSDLELNGQRIKAMREAITTNDSEKCPNYSKK